MLPRRHLSPPLRPKRAALGRMNHALQQGPGKARTHRVLGLTQLQPAESFPGAERIAAALVLGGAPNEPVKSLMNQ